VSELSVVVGVIDETEEERGESVIGVVVEDSAFSEAEILPMVLLLRGVLDPKLSTVPVRAADESANRILL